MVLTGFLLAYLAFFLLTCRAKDRGDEWGPQWLSRGLEVAMRLMLKPFGLSSKVVFDDPDGLPTAPLQRLGCCSPHGAFPVMTMSFGMFRFRNDPALRHFRLRNAGATVLFFVPILRELLLLLGVRDASRANLQKLLREGYSVALCPGGIWEQVNADHREEKCYCQKGLGFVRLAMEAGVPLLPLYTFGEGQVYHTHTLALGLRRWMAKTLRVGVPIITGPWGLPCVPLPTYAEHIMGKPIEVGPPNAKPTEAQMNEVYGRYEAEMHRLFKAHAARLLPPSVAAKGLRLEWLGHRTRVLGLETTVLD